MVRYFCKETIYTELLLVKGKQSENAWYLDGISIEI